MKNLLLPILLGTALLLAAPTHAQRAFQVGLTGGLTLATAHFGKQTFIDGTQTMPLRAGFLAGVTASWQSQGHWGARLASLYVQQGYTQRYASTTGQDVNQVRLNYLRLPLHATFSQHAGGQGFQAFAGPYLGVLLAGNRSFETSSASGSSTNRGRVVVADSYTFPEQESPYVLWDMAYLRPDYTVYSRRFDVGVQGGLGYRLGNALLQVEYTLGLRNLATTLVYPSGPTFYSVAGEPYRTRGAQASLTYFLGAQ